MGWKEDNKGAGPWEFAPQRNKWGYLNNPRWMDPPSTSISYDGNESNEPQVWDMEGGVKVGRSDAGVTHDPCGHWHRGEAPAPPKLDVNLFRVTDPWLDYGSIQSIFFNHKTKKLSLVNYYVSTPGVCAIECPDNQYLLTIEGMYDSAKLVVLDRYLNVVEKRSLFHYYDCMSPRTYHLKYYNGYVYWYSSGYTNEASVIGRFSYPGLVRDRRFSPGSVYYGSDGNLWQWSFHPYFWGDPMFYPITGDPSYYNAASGIIPDNDHSGDIVSFGDPSVYSSEAIGSGPMITVGGGRIYHSAPTSALYGTALSMYNCNTFSRLNTVIPTNYSFCIYFSSHGYIYASAGVFDAYRIQRLSYQLSNVNDIVIYNRGHVLYNYCICDIGNYIAVASTAYGTGYSGITLLNPDLSEVSYRLLYYGCGEAEYPQCLISHGNFLFVGENDHVSVYELVGTDLVFLDRIYVYWESVDIGYVSKWMKLMTV